MKICLLKSVSFLSCCLPERERTSTTSVKKRPKLYCVTYVLWAIYNHGESAADDSGVKPKNISCINPLQDADHGQAALQAVTNWQVQLLADKAITSVILCLNQL